jgi:hypothetical protein
MKRNSPLIYIALFLATIFCIPKSSAIPYVGFDAQTRAVSLRGLNAHVFSKRAAALHVYTGHVLNEDFSIETGFHSAKSSKGGASLKMKGIHGMLIYNLPLNVEKTVSLLGGAGLAHIRNHARHPAYRLDLSRCVPKVLAGAEYHFVPELAIRFAFVWESSKSLSKKPERFNNTYALSTGLRYQF